jgi:hypothetical protein
MSHAYTPGLKVTDHTLVTRERILPLKGEVVVKVGDRVQPDDVIAHTHLPGSVESINIANLLSVPPEDIGECMLKKEGDPVRKDEVIALSKSFFGMFKSEARSPIDGTVENISSVTGQVLLRGAPQPVQVKAYLKGEVVEVYPHEGVAVRTWASFVQGIFGIGGETNGELMIVCANPNDILSDEKISATCAGKIIVGGSLVTVSALGRAVTVGAKGIVVGGIDDRDLRDFLGYDLGVAITGQEEKGITLVVTEGFGKIAMARRTFDLLKKNEGKLACLNGATQIRAGVIRPEVVIPIERPVNDTVSEEPGALSGLAVGSTVRVIRQPYFGKLGVVTALPPDLQVLESGSAARVLEIEFRDKTHAVIPRANVEMIEEM